MTNDPIVLTSDDEEIPVGSEEQEETLLEEVTQSIEETEEEGV